MKIKRSLGSKIFDTFNVAFMFFMMFIMLYPFWHVIMASFSSPSQIMSHEGLLFTPAGFSLSAYKFVFNYRLIWTGYLNTLFVVIVGTVLNVFASILMAYVLTRKNFPLRRPVSIMMLITMYFSGGIIPRYLLIAGTLNMDNSLWVLIIPTLISTYNVLILRTAFFNVPESLEESARLDGANDFIILFAIILPTIMSTVAVITLYYAVGHWNSWFPAMVYIRKRELWPLALVLRQIIILSEIKTDDPNAADTEQLQETIKYATILVSTIPILCVYPFLQRFFVKGVMIGAVKG